MNYDKVQALLNDQAEKRARIKLIPFDGSIEIKTISGEKYLYARKREGGKNKSTYIDVYSDERYELLLRQAQELRTLKKELRKIEKELASEGYTEAELSPRVLLNIDFARANVKSLIYDQAVLEGISTTFPQTDAILENGIVNGVRAQDVQKILNLKHAWEFILDKDVIRADSNYYLLCHIARLVNEGFFYDGGRIRGIPVTIGGTNYIPPIPIESQVSENIRDIINSGKDTIDIAIDLCMYCMRTQIFVDGNKRASVLFANHYMIAHGLGLIVIPENYVSEFKKILVAYYESADISRMNMFLKEKCWRKLK
jgi:prophage maintenance system killer protein